MELVWGKLLSPSIRPEILGELAAIVDRKGWSIWDGARRKGILESIAAMFGGASADEAALLLSLIGEYDIFQDYRRLAFDLLDGLVADGISEAIFCPVKLSSHSKTKSGQNFIYEIDSLFAQYPDCDYESLDNPLQQKFVFDPRPKILVDDFIGTGDQLSDVLDEFEALDPLLRFDRVMVIAIQEEARANIQNSLGIPVQCLYERSKGMPLAQAKQNRPLQECYDIYSGIVARAGTPQEYALGYRQTEALITLKRTPDNTMGIFWFGGDGKWPAPFPR